MYKLNLALNNIQCLICHKTKPNQSNKFIYIYIYMKRNMVHFFLCFFLKLNLFLLLQQTLVKVQWLRHT